jgi:hypothetical protein
MNFRLGTWWSNSSIGFKLLRNLSLIDDHGALTISYEAFLVWTSKRSEGGPHCYYLARDRTTNNSHCPRPLLLQIL